MQQLTFDSFDSNQLTELIAESPPPSLLNIQGKADHELLQLLGFEVGQCRGSIHEILKSMQGIDPRITALTELMRRYIKTPLPRGKAFGSPHDIYLHYQHLRELKQEHFIVVLLNNKHEVQEEITVTIGTLNRTVVSPREVFSEAIKQRAAAIICLHNHPSGRSSASQNDIDMTRRLRETGQVVGIPLLDHIIIGNNQYTSLADQGWI